MSIPDFDPWHDSKRPHMRAYCAYCAYPGADLGTIGTIGTPAVSKAGESIGDDGRRWLQQLLAAKSQILAVPSVASPIEKLLQSAICFCLSPWAQRLASLGWQEHDLFAVAHDGQAGGLIQRLAGGHIRLATSDAVYAVVGSKLFRCVRQRSCLCALPKIWDTEPQR